MLKRDQIWIERQPLKVGCNALKMARFARTVQATYLLNTSIHIAARTYEDENFTLDHVKQLDRTLKALSSLNVAEGDPQSTAFCVPNATCVE